jgi:hypothetical protein
VNRRPEADGQKVPPSVVIAMGALAVFTILFCVAVCAGWIPR